MLKDEQWNVEVLLRRAQEVVCNYEESHINSSMPEMSFAVVIWCACLQEVTL